MQTIAAFQNFSSPSANQTLDPNEHFNQNRMRFSKIVVWIIISVYLVRSGRQPRQPVRFLLRQAAS